MAHRRPSALKPVRAAVDRTGIVSLLRRLRRDQDGIALPVATSSLALVVLLAGGVAATSVQTNTAVIEDRAAKQAQGAAETGIQLAYPKLSESSRTLQPNECLTPGGEVPPNAFGECDPFEVDLGSGQRVRYVISTPTSGVCPVLPGKEPIPGDRCVTSTGTSGVNSRRLQARVNLLPGIRPFEFVGVLARDLVDIDNNSDFSAVVGANGEVNVAKGRFTHNVIVGPDGQVVYDKLDKQIVWVGDAKPSTRETEWPFPEVEFEPFEVQNNNARLPTFPGMSFVRGSTTAPQLDDLRHLTITGANVELRGGDYSLCQLDFLNNTTVTIPDGEIVRIFVDSPRRTSPTDSSCANVEGAGTINAPNSLVLNPTGEAEQLQFYVYGTDNDSLATPDVSFNNRLTMNATIYAPDASVTIKNSGDIVGGVVGKNVDFKNNAKFTWPTSIYDMELPGTKGTVRRGWFECNPTAPNPNDPESGCVP